MSHSVILTVSRVAIIAARLCFCCFVMKQMWLFGHVGDLLLHDSGRRRAAAYAGAAHRKGFNATHAAAMWLQWIDASYGLQMRRSQVRLSSSQRVTDPTDEQSSANPGEALKSRTFTLFLQVENEFHFCENEKAFISWQFIKLDFITSKMYWKNIKNLNIGIKTAPAAASHSRHVQHRSCSVLWFITIRGSIIPTDSFIITEIWEHLI